MLTKEDRKKLTALKRERSRILREAGILKKINDLDGEILLLEMKEIAETCESEDADQHKSG